MRNKSTQNCFDIKERSGEQEWVKLEEKKSRKNPKKKQSLTTEKENNTGATVRSKCSLCGIEIDPERIEVGFDKCVSCSDTAKVVGFMDYSHKTAGECVIVEPKNSKVLRLARRANERKR